MTPDEMRHLLRQEPFQPFRVHLKDGRTFNVLYPDINMVTGSTFYIGIPFAGAPDPRAERLVQVDWRTIDHVESLFVPPYAQWWVAGGALT